MQERTVCPEFLRMEQELTAAHAGLFARVRIFEIDRLRCKQNGVQLRYLGIVRVGRGEFLEDRQRFSELRIFVKLERSLAIRILFGLRGCGYERNEKQET